MTLRLYFSDGTAGYTPTTFRGSWEKTTDVVTRKLGPKAGSITTVSSSETSSSTTYDVGLGRFVSDPFLRGGTLNTDTIRLVYGHSSATTGAFRAVIAVWVSVGDSSTVRGWWTPSGVDRQSGSTWSTVDITQRWGAFAPGAFGDATIAVQAGDRLVFELGARAATTTTTTRTAALYYGGTGATDLPDSGDADPTTQPGWVDVTGPLIESLWIAPATAPTVGAGADVASHYANNAFTRTGTETDNGAAITSRAWTIQAGPTGVGTTIGTAAALSWTPTTAGAYTLRFAATNSVGTGTDDMSITVVAQAAPTVGAGADVASHQTSTVFARTGTESANGSAITSRAWTIQAGPTGVGTTIGTAAALSWTPTVTGSYTLRFAATNGVGTGTDDMSITVLSAPTVNAGADVTGHTASTAFARTATENDNGASITSRAWTIQAGPAGVGTTIGTAAALSWTPTTTGTYTLRYAATNSAGTGTDDVSITVVSAPTVGAGVDVASHPISTVFARSATENANGSTITSRAWTIQSGPAGVGTTISTAAALSWTPTTAGSYVLRYAATNSVGTGTDDMSILVELGPRAPGSVFDLSNFKWQGPFEDPNDPGDVIEVEPPELDTYLNEDFFYVDGSGRMVCKAPCQGFTTSGSGSARSELRELENGIEAAWTPFEQGVRQLTVTERVDPTSLTDRQEMIIGQIHAGANPAIYIAAEWESSGAPVTPRLRVFKDRNDGSGSTSGVGNMLSGELSPTTDFTWRIRVEQETVSVSAVVGSVGDLPGAPNFIYNATNDFEDDAGWYFKVGSYNKSTVAAGGTGTAIATISYLELLQGEEPPPPVVASGGFLPFFAA